MSKSYVQDAIAKAFEADSNRVFTAGDLIAIVYPDAETILPVHRQAVSRAAKKGAGRMGWIRRHVGYGQKGRLGRRVEYLHPDKLTKQAKQAEAGRRNAFAAAKPVRAK